MNWYLVLAPLGGQKITWIFNNFRISSFWKSLMGCPNRQLLSKKVHFLHFCADLSKKIFITLIQKMIWFIGFWDTAYEILAIKISKRMLTQQKSNKILRLQTPISPKQLSHNIINNTISLKCVTRPFRLIYVNCFARLI